MSYYNKIFNIAYINLLLVIFGYFIVSRYGTGLSPLLKFIRILFLIYSFYALNKIVSYQNIKNNYSSKILFMVFLVLIFISSIMAEYPIYVLSNLLVFVPSIMFTIFLVNTSFNKLGLEGTKILLLRLFIMCFSIPLISSIFFNGNYYLGKDLYGQNFNTMGESVRTGFYSNHLAWSGIIVLSSSFAYLEMSRLKKSKKLLLYFLMLFSVMTIINSGSRAILATLIIYFFAFFLKNLNFIKTLILSCFIIFSFTKVDFSKLDSINFMINRTNVHLVNQENFARFAFLSSGLKLFDENPLRYLTGIGLFNRKVIKEQNFTFISGHRGEYSFSNFHNSYADILFGGGIFVFFIFVYLVLYKSLRQLWKFDDKYFLLVIPLHLIAMTESSLQGGQFIFYPLFYFICVSNLKCLNVNYTKNDI